MNFYKHYIGDFQRDTGHLSLTERGAYRALLDAHYASEKPLPTVDSELCRLVGAFEDFERQAIKRVLREFWQLTEAGWVNKRAQIEIEKMAHQRDINREIGKRGGRPKKTESVTEPITESVSESKPNRNPIQTPDTRHQTKSLERAPRASPRGARLPTDWGLSDEAKEFAKGLRLDPDAVLARFRDYWISQPGAKGVKTNWDATWRNWCRNEAERGTSKQAFNPKFVTGPAEQAWSDLIATDGAKRDHRVQRALDAIGGWLAVKARTQFNEQKLREQFCRAYSEAA